LREFTLISGSIAKFANVRTLARNAAEQIHERFAIPRILSIVIFDEAGHDWKFDNRPEPSPPSEHNVDDLAMSIFRGRLESLGENHLISAVEHRVELGYGLHIAVACGIDEQRGQIKSAIVFAELG
jgi:hypothetical protein